MKYVILYLILTITATLLAACGRDKKPNDIQARMVINFVHKVNNEPLITDQMIYTNAAGNVYEVTEVMYFISDLKLHRSDGTIVEPATWNDIHYVDTNIPSTLTWGLPDDIPAGTYDSITFIFGISEEKNKDWLFNDPPEVNMAWPTQLGGGYHYLMLNGWWRDTLDARRSYNFHLGIGQIYENGSITGFIQNFFTVRPQGGSFEALNLMLIEAEITMNIENWFQNPHDYDHNHWGGAIMQNQAAIQMGCENGHDVFSIAYTLRPNAFALE